MKSVSGLNVGACQIFRIAKGRYRSSPEYLDTGLVDRSRIECVKGCGAGPVEEGLRLVSLPGRSMHVSSQKSIRDPGT